MALKGIIIIEWFRNRKIYWSRKNKISWPIVLPYILNREATFLNDLVGVYETQIDENQNFLYKVWEWK